MPSTELVKRHSYPPVPVRRQREPESAPGRAFRWARRETHLSVPLAVPPAFWGGALLMHAVPHGPGITLLGTGITAGCVWYFAPHKWTDKEGMPREREVWYARLSAAAGAGWLSLASWLSPADGWTGVTLTCLLAAGGLAWGIPWWHHKRPRGRRRRDKALARWDAWWQLHASRWGVAGSRVTEAREEAVMTRLFVQLAGGDHTLDMVRAALPRIESALDGVISAHGMVSVHPVAERTSLAEVRVKLANPLGEDIGWDPSLAPRSVHDPWPVGMTESGRWRMAPQRVSSFGVGMTDSGKTNLALVRLACLSGCPDARTVLIDLKGGRSARPALAACAAEYVITEVPEARMFLRMLCAEITARALWCYRDEEGQHRATEEIPAIFALIDETFGLTSVAKGDAQCAADLATAASTGRELEIYADVRTQYGALEDSVRTEQTRMNLPLRTACRTETQRHGSYAIEDPRADASKLEGKGEFLLKLGPKADTEKLRSAKMPHSLLREIAAANRKRLGDLPPLVLYCGNEWAIEPGPDGTGGVTWDDWWKGRWGRVHPAFSGYPQPLEWAASQPEPAAEAAPAAPQAQPAQPAPHPAAGSTQAPAPPPAAPASTRKETEARQRAAFATALQSAAQSGIMAGELAGKSGMGRTQVHDLLRRLGAAGMVTQPKDKGPYFPAPGADIAAAVTALKAGDDALLGKARERHGLYAV